MLASSKTFGIALGHATWLMAVSTCGGSPGSSPGQATNGSAATNGGMEKTHRDRPISWLEEMLFPALAMKQFKLYFKGKQPVALVIFSFVSDEVKERWEKDKTMPKLTDWRSGKNVIVLECVSPFAERQVVIVEFMAALPEGVRGG